MSTSKPLALIVQEINVIEQILIESQGTIDEQLEALIAVNKNELADKIDGYSIIDDRLDFLANHYKQRAEYFMKISAGCKKTQANLKENIKQAMKELGTDEIAGTDIRFKLSKTKPALVIDDEGAIPREYYQSITIEQLNKDRLKDDLAIGPVPGAQLRESFSLRSYANNKIKKVTRE